MESQAQTPPASATTVKKKGKKGKKKAVAQDGNLLTVDTQSNAGDSDISEVEQPSETPKRNGLDAGILRSEARSPLLDAVLQKELKTEKEKNRVLEEELAKLRLSSSSKDKEDDSKSNSEAIERLQGQLNDALKQLADAKEQAEGAKKEASRMKELEEALARTRKECDECKAEAWNAKKESDDERKRAAEVEAKLKSKDQELEAARKELSASKSSSSASASNLETKLLEAQQERDQAKAAQEKAEEETKNIDLQYRNLLERVKNIKATIGEKLKADAEELEELKGTVAELEEQNKELETSNSALEAKLKDSNAQVERLDRELGNLRSRMNLAQANWTRERDELVDKEKRLRDEYDAATQAMRDWETIAMEERGVRSDLEQKVVELEEQLASERTVVEKLTARKAADDQMIAQLQNNVHELQEARRTEMREMQAATETQISALNSKVALYETKAKDSEAQLIRLQEELARMLPFEKEVKEKSLLIGKLRHEAVTLNDHLTKALRMLKKGNASDNVDKQLVTNVFLSFLSAPRGDTKKYEILQLIASVLDWNDEQREKAGLVRPGASSLKIPTPSSPTSGSAFSRSPSTSTLGEAYDGSRELWTAVLEGSSSNNS